MTKTTKKQTTKSVNRIELIHKTSEVLDMADKICDDEEIKCFREFRNAIFQAWIELNNAIIAECDKSLKSRA